MTPLPIYAEKYKQVLVVIVAFFAMIAVSYMYVKEIVQDQIEINGIEVMNSSRATVQSLLSEVEVSLLSMAFAVESMVNNGAPSKEIEKQLYALADSFYATGHRYFAFNGIYGSIKDAFMDSSRWTPYENYNPKERPWYVGALQDKGTVHYSRPFMNVRTGKPSISASRLIYDKEGEECGVLAINLDMTTVSEFIKKLQVAGAGYGLLINDAFEIVAHKDENLIGVRLDSLGGPYIDLVNRIQMGEEVNALEMISYDGTPSVVFMSTLPNGWIIGTVTPVAIYYSKVRSMTLVLPCLGLLLMTVLGYLLVKLYSERDIAYERSETKSTFLAKMSHEIRTPMNAIVGMSELILRDSDILPPKTCSYARSIKQSSANLLSIINDILDFSKIESGRLELVKGNYLFSSLINDTLNIIRIRVQEKPILFVANIDPSVPNKLFGDEIRVRQILLNLLSNAVKYTNEGFISFTVSSEMRPENTILLTITVADSGIGITEENLEKLFDNFVRLDIAHNKGVEGTGLGLAITRSLCIQMGGDITVSSVYGEGSIFTSTLEQRYTDRTPFASVSEPHKKYVLIYDARAVYATSLAKTLEKLRVPHLVVSDQSTFFEALDQHVFSDIFLPAFLYESVKATMERQGFKGSISLISQDVVSDNSTGTHTLVMPAHALSVANILNKVADADSYADENEVLRFTFPTARILVVDDIMTNLSVAEGLFLPYEMHMDFCQSGSEAIALVKQNEYDIVFMDHMMPGMNGIEATTIIRGLPGERFKKMPIIALTANAVAGMREIFLKNGMNDFLAKPIETAKLNAILMRWIPSSKRERRQDERTAKPALEMAIPGLDTKLGLAMAGGSIPSYIKILGMFHTDASERIGTLRQSVQDEDIQTYGICIHALKSAAANIGSQKISGLASALESAARNEDTEFLQTNTEPFILELTKLLHTLESLKQQSAPAPASSPPDDETMLFLYTSLRSLRTAMDRMDARRIDEIMNALQAKQWPGDIQSTLEMIAHNILIFEYDEAREGIDSLLP